MKRVRNREHLWPSSLIMLDNEMTKKSGIACESCSSAVVSVRLPIAHVEKLKAICRSQCKTKAQFLSDVILDRWSYSEHALSVLIQVISIRSIVIDKNNITDYQIERLEHVLKGMTALVEQSSLLDS